MGNTVTVGKNIEIVYDATPGNFSVATYFPDEVLLQAVKTKGLTSVIVRNGSSTGEILSYFSDSVGDGKKDTFIPPKWCKPYILASECTLPVGAVVILELA